MPDLFISYSRKDSEQALQLTERLRSSGIDVWIDQHGIEAASSWSKEIVKAIDDCTAMMVLISANSLDSPNVSREVGIASESRKRMLPVALEDIKLSDELRYHLSGIQRVAYTQFDAITAALHGFGIVSHKSGRDAAVPRKSLMVLPFEDLSPTQDNGWFADGIVSELISKLSSVKALKIADSQATKEFKQYRGQLATYGKDMGIRYFVHGDVRKFGDQIKIAVSLLDIETGDHLWQDSMKGMMSDIFEIQEQVALKVIDGLNVHLESTEKQKLRKRGTDNPEAYELSLRASEFFQRQTREGYLLDIRLLTEAIRLDPNYAFAYASKASALTVLYRSYDPNPALLTEAESLCREALRLKPDSLGAYNALTYIYMYRGDRAEAEKTAIECIRLDPESHVSHFTLAHLYASMGEYAKAVASYEEATRLKPEEPIILWNLVVICDEINDVERRTHWARLALPQFERYLRFHPDDVIKQLWYATLLFFIGRTEEARTSALQFTDLQDGGALYNLATLFALLGDKAKALEVFRKSIEAGYRMIRNLKEFLELPTAGVLTLAGTTEYEEAKRVVESLENELKQHA